MRHRSSIKELLVLFILIATLVVVFISGTIYQRKIQEEVSKKAQLINSETFKKQREESIIASLPDITCWGDGLTMGNGSDGPSYPEILSQLAHLTVHNMGVKLEDSATIATRQGGRYIVLNDITIPSTTNPIQIGTSNNLINNAFESVSLLKNGDVGINPVSIAGIEGTLSITEDRPAIYYFTRHFEGDEFSIQEPTPLLTAASQEHNKDITIIFIGQNGGYETIDQLIDQQMSMIEHLGHDKYLILGLTTGTGNSRAELEQRLSELYGEKFINLREYLVTDGLNDANLQPTEDDLANIAIGKLPASLLVDEGIVGNSIYHKLIAEKILDKILELNYLTEPQQQYLGLS